MKAAIDRRSDEMDEPESARLRVLVADGRPERLDQVTRTVASLGHEVITRTEGLEEVGRTTAIERPDLAVVIVGESTDESLRMIGRIVREAACPVIAVLDVQDRAFINRAARRGIFAYISGGEDASEFQSSIDITLQRFAEYQNLEGAFGRRAITERAKGILMERHSIDERAAFDMLRDEARRTQRKVVDVAEGVASSHRLLSHGPGAEGASTEAEPPRG
jgi:AmiR/NasT family two-component response regulator